MGMFDWLVGKRTLEFWEVRQLISTVTNMFYTQIKLAGGLEYEPPQEPQNSDKTADTQTGAPFFPYRCLFPIPVLDFATPKDTKALGYVYGAIDAALRRVGQDIDDPSIGIPVTVDVLNRVIRHGDYYLKFIKQHIEDDQNMNIGVMKGRQEYTDWAKGKNKAPTGLTDYVRELRMHQQK